MKRAFVLAVVALCMGQSCGGPAAPVPEPEPVFDRLAVNDHLRAVCYPQYMTDTDIETALVAMKNGIEFGQTKQVQLQNVAVVCGRNGPSMPCITCWNAIVNQVWGE